MPNIKLMNGPDSKVENNYAREHYSHCSKCYSSLCKFNLCPLIICDACKSVRFHQCKLHEHLLLCDNVVTNCINKPYGCPVKLKRKHLSSHLSKCPASVCVCSIEWNRWPLHTSDRPNCLPFGQQPPQGTTDQLDMALAIRDQKMLDEALKAPKAVRRSLINAITKQFPAVPFPVIRSVPKWMQVGCGVSRSVSSCSSVKESDEDFSWSDAPWGNRRRDPPGLSRSMLKVIGGMGSCSEDDEGSNVAPPVPKSLPPALFEDDADSSEVDSLCYTDSDGSEGRSSEDRVSTATSGIDCSCNSCSMDNLKAASAETCDKVLQNARLPINQQMVSLGLDLTVERIVKYQPKAKSMLTFWCGKSFRRDEICSHHKNIHADIESSFESIEARCPLQSLGCSWSCRRKLPTIHNTLPADIVHSEILQTFGLLCNMGKESPRREFSDCNYFERMPNELLDKILHNLDAFSLSNLALTSCRMRYECSRFVQEKGMIEPEWVRKSKGKWSVGFYKWSFSSAIIDIDKWIFLNSNGLISNHLKLCKYNDVIPREHEKPIPLLNLTESPSNVQHAHNNAVYQKVRALFGSL